MTMDEPKKPLEPVIRMVFTGEVYILRLAIPIYQIIL
jgi:hypothetical protein